MHCFQKLLVHTGMHAGYTVKSMYCHTHRCHTVKGEADRPTDSTCLPALRRLGTLDAQATPTDTVSVEWDI